MKLREGDKVKIIDGEWSKSKLSSVYNDPAGLAKILRGVYTILRVSGGVVYLDKQGCWDIEYVEYYSDIEEKIRILNGI